MLPSFTTIIDTAKEMGNLFNVAKGKLLNNPTEASEKLAGALGELTLILDFVEKETVRYLQIIFLSDKSNFIECRTSLLFLESGYITIKGYEARGHCHKITNIYDKYLDHWFSKVLDPQEADQMKCLFDKMNTADDGMIDCINDITNWLKDEAQAILQMVDDEQLDIANQKIKQARIDMRQTRRNIVEALAQLKLLQSSFIASSQSV